MTFSIIHSFPEIPPVDKTNSNQMVVFGSEVLYKHIEMVVIGLVVMGVVLFLIACSLLGVVLYLQRQKKLRRNRRSILDEGFKLMSTKNHDI